MASQEDLRKALSVEHFKIDPNDLNAEKEYEFWKTKFELYVASLKANDEQKLHILTNKLNATIYGYIDGLKDYGEAIQKLDSVFKKKPNILFARYKLSTLNQNPNEPIEAYVLRLLTIAKDCAFADVNAKQYQDEMVLGSFIRGIEDTFIRQRLLETKTLTLEDAVNNATILRRAYDNARGFESGQETTKSIAVVDVELEKEVNDLEHCAVTTKGK